MLYCDVCDGIVCGNCDACSTCHPRGGWSGEDCVECQSSTICTNCGACDHCGQDSDQPEDDSEYDYKEWAFRKRLSTSEKLRQKLLHKRSLEALSRRREFL